MKVNFDNVISRFDTHSKRWDQICCLEHKNPNLIPMGIADMDFPTPPEVITAIKERLEHPLFGYTMPHDSLIDTIVQFIKKRHNWDIDPEWIVLYPTATLALSYILQALQSPKRQIILQPPVFGPFYGDIKHEHFFPLDNPLHFDGSRYTMDFDHLEELFQTHKNIRALVLCNPHNPVGRVWTKEELTKLGDICIKNDCLVLSDELHSDLTFTKHTIFGSINKEFAQNSVISMSSGKSFNLSGMKISYCIIPNPKLRQLIEMASLNKDPNILGMVAYEAALKAGDDYYLNELKHYIKENFNFLDNYIKTHIPKIKLIQSEGTFLAWIDMRNLKMTQKELEDFMLKEVEVCPTFGYTFGQGGEGFIRLNIASPRCTIEKVAERLKNSISNL